MPSTRFTWPLSTPAAYWARPALRSPSSAPKATAGAAVPACDASASWTRDAAGFADNARTRFNSAVSSKGAGHAARPSSSMTSKTWRHSPAAGSAPNMPRPCSQSVCQMMRMAAGSAAAVTAFDAGQYRSRTPRTESRNNWRSSLESCCAVALMPVPRPLRPGSDDSPRQDGTNYAHNYTICSNFHHLPP